MEDKKQAVLALDIGGSKLMAAFIDRQGNILAREKAALTEGTGKEALGEQILRLSKALGQARPDVSLRAVGAAIPGLADAARGVWVYACFSGIRDWAFAAELSAALGVPVLIANDVNACALGEMTYGCCQDTRDFLWVTVSNGCGGAVVAKGQVYEGAWGGSGEIGHVIVEEENPRPCPCGHRGCLEAQASGRAIAAAYKEMTGRALSARDIAARAKEGEAEALAVYRRTGRYLGKAVACFVNALNPEKVVLGGGVSMDADLFLPALRETLRERVFLAANPRLAVEKTALGYDAALLGAAAVGWGGLI